MTVMSLHTQGSGSPNSGFHRQDPSLSLELPVRTLWVSDTSHNQVHVVVGAAIYVN